MALIKCPECGKEVSDSAEKCPSCGYGIKKYAEEKKKREQQQAIQQAYDNMSTKSKTKSYIVLGVIIVLLIWGVKSCMKNAKADPNDGKCDICGKPATYSDGDEEYCDKHLKDAVNWYKEQGDK